MLLVIFGAGASYDSVDRALSHDPSIAGTEWAPPLATELFANRPNFGAVIDAYPECQALIVELRATVRDNRPLEEALDAVNEEAATDSARASQLMAVRFYLRDLLRACGKYWLAASHGCTNYHYLVSRLDRWRRMKKEKVVFVTFNYDTMLESACHAESGMVIEDMGDYVGENLAIIKLHGSVDWGYRMKQQPPFSLHGARYVIRNAIELQTASGLQIERRAEWQSGILGENWIPALAVPIRYKHEFACPPSHIKAMIDILPYVDRVLIVGWRGTEAPFAELMRRHVASGTHAIFVCGSLERAKETRENLEWSSPDSEVIETGLGFSNLVESVELGAFLQ